MSRILAMACGTRETRERDDFELLLEEFAEFAIESAERRLGKKAASNYKSRLRFVAREIDSEHGDGWFETFVLSCPEAGRAEGYRLCDHFIDDRVQAAQGKDRPMWLDRRSAFRKLVEFLEECGVKYNLPNGEGASRQKYATKWQNPDGMCDASSGKLCPLEHHCEPMDIPEDGKRSNCA